MEQLKKHIQLVHLKSGHYKTILKTSEIYYCVVTRVNYMTVMLWIEYINSIIINNPKLDYDIIKKVNWMIMLKSYRRDFKNKIINDIALLK